MRRALPLSLMLAACAADAPTSPVVVDSGAMSLCGAGGTGAGEGDVIPPVALTDCSGNTVSLQSLCGKRAAWFFVFAGW